MKRYLVSVPAIISVIILIVAAEPSAKEKIKLRGYVTAVPDSATINILDDVIQILPGAKIEVQGTEGKAPREPRAPAVGMFIEAEGSWSGKHRLAAEKINCDADQFDREIQSRAYLEVVPAFPGQEAAAAPWHLKLDGELLVLDPKFGGALRPGNPTKQNDNTSGQIGSLQRLVNYKGARQPDGSIAVKQLEIGPAPPPEAFAIPGGMQIGRGKDQKTDVEFVEFREKKKVTGRMKLFPVKEVQDFVAQLGTRLLPPMDSSSPYGSLEFHFYVIESPEINAAAFPDGTVLVNTGLLGAMENEAQIAFVLSHEIAHALQAHYWRHVEETRTKRTLLTVASVAGQVAGLYLGSNQIVNLSSFLGSLGIAAVWNGYSRKLENQADRLGLQNVVDHGYDPFQALRMFRIMIERYGDRSTSAIWSNHDSSLMRGSFLTVQVRRRYPAQQFKDATVSTPAFDAMKEAMGPVKIM